MLHVLASVIAWIVAIAMALGFVGLFIWLLRVLYSDSTGKPALRVVMLLWPWRWRIRALVGRQHHALTDARTIPAHRFGSPLLG